MADPIKRLNYFDKQFLRDPDFNDEQRYHVQHQRDHARLMHTPGIAEGLQVPDPAAGASAVTVNAGVAYDEQGRRIVLPDNLTVELGTQPAGQATYLTIAYAEEQSDPTNETGIVGNRRWTEKPLIETAAAAPASPTLKLVLARVERTGTVVSVIDRSARLVAGAKSGDLTVRSLTLSSETVAPAGWVRAQLASSGSASLGGSLQVAGDLTVTGAITGNIAPNSVETGDLRDGAVTLAKLAANSVDAGKIVDGSVGTAELAGGAITNAKLAPNAVDASKIIDGSVGTAQLADGAVTLQKLAPAAQPIFSVDGVQNPGGDVDLVPAGAITLAPDNQSKRITIGESHSARNDNPHATTAAQLGALPLAGGTISGGLSVAGPLSSFNNTVRLGGAATANGNSIGLGQPGDRNITVFVSATPTPIVSTGTKAAMMIWSVADGYKALEVLGSSGGVDTVTIAGTARFTGTKIGYVADTFINGGDKVLRTGDLVKLKRGGTIRFQGDQNRIPVTEVILSDTADDPLVMGIVAQEATPPPGEPDGRTEPDDPTSIAPGGSLFVVTLGAFAHCHVDASKAPVDVGDLLTSSAQPGMAQKAVKPRIGTIIGKALEPLAGGQGYISVFVNIQ